MGGLTSFATTALQAVSLANNIVGGVRSYQNDSGDQALKQLREKNALELSNLQQKNDQEKEQIRIGTEQAEAERRAALRRAVAKQKAKFGASGIESGNGSGQAVLLGLFDESEEEKADRDSLDALKLSALDNNYAQQKRINTLELTQLKERNKLKKAGATLQSLTDIF